MDRTTLIRTAIVANARRVAVVACLCLVGASCGSDLATSDGDDSLAASEAPVSASAPAQPSSDSDPADTDEAVDLAGVKENTPEVTEQTPKLPPAPEPVAPEPVSPEPVSPEPVAPEPVSPEPVAPEPVAPEPVAPEPVAPEPVSPEPLLPGAACELGSHPDCIDVDGHGQGTYLIGGADCMAFLSPGLCSDLDGDGRAGYPDSG